MRVDEIAERYRNHVSHGSATLAAMLGEHVEVRAEGSYIWDHRGDRFLDCGGFGVFIFGHRHPAIVSAVVDQIATQPLSSKLFLNERLAGAASALAAAAPGDLQYVYLGTSGSEAVDFAIKLARLHGKTRLIAATRGFHGKTVGAISVAGNPRYREPFVPLLPDVTRVPFGDAAALEAALAGAGGRACLVIEPVQGEGGVAIPPDGYLSQAAELVRRYDGLFVLDEIQTGLGRLGHLWGADREGVVPDVLLAGKGLGGGVVPCSAVIASPRAFEPFNRDPLLHTTTFSNSPLASAAVGAVLATIEREDVVARSRELGETLLPAVEEAVLAGCPHLVTEVRGLGLMIGVEFTSDSLAGEFLMELMQHKVVANLPASYPRVIRFTPSAFLETGDVDWLVTAVAESARALGERYPAQTPLMATA